VARTAPVPVRGSFGADTEPQTAQLLEKRRSGSAPLDTSSLNLDNAPVRNPGAAAAVSAPVDLDLGLDDAPVRATTGGAPLMADAVSRPVDLDLGMDFAPPSELGPETRPPAMPVAAPAVSAKGGANSGMIEFDMDALSMDPDSRSGGELNTQQSPDADDDPIATKLALAQEFHAIGDTDGARTLVKEVVAEASGSLKARAERFLAELG
jgi:pilus assembly protein FimV